jgi:hypothetical protein
MFSIVFKVSYCMHSVAWQEELEPPPLVAWCGTIDSLPQKISSRPRLQLLASLDYCSAAPHPPPSATEQWRHSLLDNWRERIGWMVHTGPSSSLHHVARMSEGVSEVLHAGKGLPATRPRTREGLSCCRPPLAAKPMRRLWGENVGLSVGIASTAPHGLRHRPSSPCSCWWLPLFVRRWDQFLALLCLPVSKQYVLLVRNRVYH